MISYYTSITVICWLTLLALGVLIYRNNRISRDSKRLLHLTYALIAVSLLAEWCGVQLDGRADLPDWILRTVKCADYILTPLAGGALVMQMRLNNRWQKIMMWVLGLNAALQVISAFTGGMITIDAQNHYSHGPLFPVYLGVCLVIYLLIILEIRTAYLGMTIGAALMFIHYTEFSQLEADSNFAMQQHELLTDPLTGLYNRYAYSQALQDCSDPGNLPEGFAAFSIDINGLKQVNDARGHEAGDELIRGAAECISRVFGTGTACYRTGGDEFVVLASAAGEADAEAKLNDLQAAVRGWKGSGEHALSMSAGYALAGNHSGLNAEELIRKSDLAMYNAKSEYYRNSGRDRRRRS